MPIKFTKNFLLVTFNSIVCALFYVIFFTDNTAVVLYKERIVIITIVMLMIDAVSFLLQTLKAIDDI
jgi:hypothetical protein